MKILLYGINFAPELTGIGKYTGEMAEWLAHQGHSVEVVTAPPYYPEWRVHDDYISWRWVREVWGKAANIRVTRCPLWVPAKVTGKTRLLHLASFALTSLPALISAAFRKPDALILVVPSLATAPAALLVARLWDIPIWLHVQDFEVDAMLAMDMVGGGGRLRRWALAAESWLLRRFDRTSSISPNMVARLIEKGVSPERVVEFPNWVDLDAIYPLTGDNSLRAALGVQRNEICILYSGNMGEKQGIEVVVEAARLLVDRPEFRFVFCGTGSALQRLQQAAQGLKNVAWHPLQPLEKLNELLNAADIHVLPQRAEAADLVMPSKLTGMLASGRAVIGTAHAATGLGIVLAACGVNVEPGNAVALADAIAALADNPTARETIGRRGRQYAEEHLGCDAILSGVEVQLQALADRTNCLGK